MDEQSRTWFKYGLFVTVPVGVVITLGFITMGDSFGMLLLNAFGVGVVAFLAITALFGITMMAGMLIEGYLVRRRKKKIRKRENSITIRDWEAFQKDKPPVK